MMSSKKGVILSGAAQLFGAAQSKDLRLFLPLFLFLPLPLFLLLFLSLFLLFAFAPLSVIPDRESVFPDNSRGDLSHSEKNPIRTTQKGVISKRCHLEMVSSKRGVILSGAAQLFGAAQSKDLRLFLPFLFLLLFLSLFLLFAFAPLSVIPDKESAFPITHTAI